MGDSASNTITWSKRLLFDRSRASLLMKAEGRNAKDEWRERVERGKGGREYPGGMNGRGKTREEPNLQRGNAWKCWQQVF